MCRFGCVGGSCGTWAAWVSGRVGEEVRRGEGMVVGGESWLELGFAEETRATESRKGQQRAAATQQQADHGRD